jgi:hypothetical protein
MQRDKLRNERERYKQLPKTKEVKRAARWRKKVHE